MRSLSFLVTLLFAFVASSYAWPSYTFPTLETRSLEARKKGNGTRGDGNGGNSVNKACKKMNKLTKLTELAANQTKLDEKVAANKLTTAEVDEIKAKAANATTELQTMQSNTTLVQECAVIDANRKDVGACKQMKKLQRLSEIANNETAISAMASKKGLNDTQVQKLTEKIQGAAAKLTEMQSNTTLTDFCTQRANQQKQGNNGDGSSGSSGSSGSASETAQSTGAAASLTIKTMPYALASGLTALFVLFL